MLETARFLQPEVQAMANALTARAAERRISGPQAEGLNALLADLGRTLEAVLVLDVDDEQLVKRLSGRRSCAKCGAGYNVYFEPPQQEGVCDACGGELTSRPDDDASTIRRRLQVYNDQTFPLIAFYEQTGANVRHVDGDRSVGDVQRQLVELLTEGACVLAAQ